MDADRATTEMKRDLYIVTLLAGGLGYALLHDASVTGAIGLSLPSLGGAGIPLLSVIALAAIIGVLSNVSRIRASLQKRDSFSNLRQVNKRIKDIQKILKRIK